MVNNNIGNGALNHPHYTEKQFISHLQENEAQGCRVHSGILQYINILYINSNTVYKKTLKLALPYIQPELMNYIDTFLGIGDKIRLKMLYTSAQWRDLLVADEVLNDRHTTKTMNILGYIYKFNRQFLDYGGAWSKGWNFIDSFYEKKSKIKVRQPYEDSSAGDTDSEASDYVYRSPDDGYRIVDDTEEWNERSMKAAYNCLIDKMIYFDAVFQVLWYEKKTKSKLNVVPKILSPCDPRNYSKLKKDVSFCPDVTCKKQGTFINARGLMSHFKAKHDAVHQALYIYVKHAYKGMVYDLNLVSDNNNSVALHGVPMSLMNDICVGNLLLGKETQVKTCFFIAVWT